MKLFSRNKLWLGCWKDGNDLPVEPQELPAADSQGEVPKDELKNNENTVHSNTQNMIFTQMKILPYTLSSRSMFSWIHYPANVMFNRRIQTMASFPFTSSPIIEKTMMNLYFIISNISHDYSYLRSVLCGSLLTA